MAAIRNPGIDEGAKEFVTAIPCYPKFVKVPVNRRVHLDCTPDPVRGGFLLLDFNPLNLFVSGEHHGVEMLGFRDRKKKE